MNSRATIAQQGLSGALRLRARAGLKPWEAVCVYDLAQNFDVEVRFVDVPSLEGMYWKGSAPTIILPSERPSGRQRFSCAHELGHHVFSHGTKVDEFVAAQTQHRTKDAKEFLADCFAGFLLMPKTAVLKGFSARGLDCRSCSAKNIFRVACWLGVGYSTLIYHLQASLGVLPHLRANELLRMTPKAIRSSLLGNTVSETLVLVDELWDGRPVDVQVGDLLLVAGKTNSEGKVLRPRGEIRSGKVFVATAPGIGKLWAEHSDWSTYVRVSRKNYVGRSIFRHLEEADEDG